jgi:hypothetical protein
MDQSEPAVIAIAATFAVGPAIEILAMEHPNAAHSQIAAAQQVRIPVDGFVRGIAA